MKQLKKGSILIITLLLLMVMHIKSSAQNLVAVQNGSNQAFYLTLDIAISQAQSGDTIYIPGGGFTISVPISKRLHIFGVGHNPDSTIATNYTLVSGDLIILSNASNGSLTGLYCNGAVRFGNSQSNQAVSNLQVSRCNIQGGIFLGNTDTSSATNNTFYQNVIFGVVDFYNSQNNAFYNNVINLAKNIGLNNIFRNNIFNMTGTVNYQDPYFWYGCNTSFVNAVGSVFENNIFRGRLLSREGYNLQFSNCVFYNNLFAYAVQCGAAMPTCTGCMDFNSILNQPDDNIFLNYPAGQVFQYSLNYQLKSTSLGKNAGNDGTDVGIYGGLFPWKEGSLPINPHIQFKNISTTTNSNGSLPINIKVKAQDH